MEKKEAITKTLVNMAQYAWLIFICIFGIPLSIYFDDILWPFFYIFSIWIVVIAIYGFWKYNQFRKDLIKEPTNNEVGGEQ